MDPGRPHGHTGGDLAARSRAALDLGASAPPVAPIGCRVWGQARPWPMNPRTDQGHDFPRADHPPGVCRRSRFWPVALRHSGWSGIDGVGRVLLRALRNGGSRRRRDRFVLPFAHHRGSRDARILTGRAVSVVPHVSRIRSGRTRHRSCHHGTTTGVVRHARRDRRDADAVRRRATDRARLVPGRSAPTADAPVAALPAPRVARLVRRLSRRSSIDRAGDVARSRRDRRSP